MREIKANQIKDKIKELFLKANFYINPDLMQRLGKALKEESSTIGKYVLQMIIENNKIASREEVPICQDTGLAVVFVPAIIYTDIIPGDKIKFLVMPKGFGSENMSAIAMLKPADGPEGIVNFVVETVKKAGPNPCPPTIIGVGIGGTIDKAMVIAKRAIVRKNNQPNKNPKFAALENEILTKINNLGIGPAGLGGNITSLAVHIDYLPTHIAGMPVAVNVCCHAARHAEGIL
jgi:fumarate hydratase subunit alpha